MAVKGNKGEWSELYAFLKILSDKVLYSADENLTLIPQAFIKVLKVIRQERSDFVYEIDHINNQIIIKEHDHSVLAIPIIKISSKLSNILKKIQRGGDGSKGAFEIGEAEELMDELHTKKLKSAANKKADVYVTIDDQVTGTQPTKGFSIKSQIGGMSTLLNASGSTNFEFKIVKGRDQMIIVGPRPLIGLGDILASDETLEYVTMSNDTFQTNLMMIDSQMPLIVAEMIKGYYLGWGKEIAALTEYIKKINPLKSKSAHFYEYKIQELLRAVAFGMQPAKLWKGDYETHGGYIIVKQNGELACYHTYDRDSFGKFLYQNTRLETPSTSRHQFGEIFFQNGIKHIKLNLQIRFTT